jgi:hypothetical protein
VRGSSVLLGCCGTPDKGRRSPKEAAVKRSLVKTGLLAGVVALAAVIVLGGCSSTNTTTTTVSATSTSTSQAATTSTTPTSESTTTTAGGPPTVSHQNNEPRFTYSGKWRTVSASSASGKSLAVADTSGASVTVRFEGTSIYWLAKKSPAYGQAKLTLDGGESQTVDLYSASTVWKKKVWQSGTLEPGDHTVTVSWTGKKSQGGTGSAINVDAFVITGVVIGLFQQNNPKISYAGTWKTSSATALSGRSYAYADTSGASVTASFTGVELVWIARVGPVFGQAEVTVDGGTAATIDLYSAATKYQQRIFDTGTLPLGNHTVKIVWLGTKNEKATGTRIDVDAFEVAGVLR